MYHTISQQAKLPELEPATTYYWRVRATEPILSPWSPKWSFTTTLVTELIAPELLSPEAGASEVSIKPSFQWSTIVEAENYEFIVSTSHSFENPVILKVGDYALPSATWQCNIDLNYDTTYYWKVRAVSADTHSAWSAVGEFTTKPPPPSPQEQALPPETSPPPPPEKPLPPTIPDWMKYSISALLAAVILLSAIVLMLVRGTRQPRP